jgi:hypothetical protein
MDFKLEINGLDKLKENLSKFPREIASYLAGAGREAAENVVFPTEGLKRYPPATSQRYVRGRGTQTLTRNYNDSERYGTQFYSRNEGAKTFLGNRTSYAQWLTDENLQSKVMANKGWKKLVDVVNDKLNDIREVYNQWVSKAIKDLGL